MDAITEKRIMTLHPSIRVSVKNIWTVCDYRKVPFRVVQGLRTIDEQDGLYAQGRTQEQLNLSGLPNVKARPDLPKVTNARGGDSWHNFGFAVDCCLLRGEKQISWSRNEDLDADGVKDWEEMVQEFMKVGFEWGGNWQFKDYPHFQKIFGLTIKKAKELFTEKKIDSNGYLLI